MSVIDSIYNITESLEGHKGVRSSQVSDAMSRSLSINDIVRMHRISDRKETRPRRPAPLRVETKRDRRMISDNDGGVTIDPSKFASAFRNMSRGEQRPSAPTSRPVRISDEVKRRREMAERRRVKDDDEMVGNYTVQKAEKSLLDTPETHYTSPYSTEPDTVIETDSTASINDIKLLDLLLSNFRDCGQKGFLTETCPVTVQCVKNLTNDKEFPIEIDNILNGVNNKDPRAQAIFCEEMLAYKEMIHGCGISSLFLAGLENATDTYVAIHDLFFPEYTDDEEEVEAEAEETLLEEGDGLENLEDIENILQQIIAEAQIEDSAKQRVHDNIIRRTFDNMMRHIKDSERREQRRRAIRHRERVIKDESNLKEVVSASSVLADLESYLKDEIAQEVLEEVGETYDLETKDEETEDMEDDFGDEDFDMGVSEGDDDFGEGDLGDDDFDTGEDEDFDMDSDFEDFDVDEGEGDEETIDFDSDESIDGEGSETIGVDQVAELALALAKVLQNKDDLGGIASDSVRGVVKGVNSLTRPIKDSAQTYIPVSKEEYSGTDAVANLVEATYLMGERSDKVVSEAEVCGNVVLANKTSHPQVLIPRPSVELPVIEEAIKNNDMETVRSSCVPMEEVQTMAAATNTLCALDEGFYKSNPLSEGWEYDEPNQWTGYGVPNSGTVYPAWQSVGDSAIPIKIKGVDYKIKARV